VLALRGGDRLWREYLDVHFAPGQAEPWQLLEVLTLGIVLDACKFPKIELHQGFDRGSILHGPHG